MQHGNILVVVVKLFIYLPTAYAIPGIRDKKTKAFITVLYLCFKTEKSCLEKICKFLVKQKLQIN